MQGDDTINSQSRFGPPEPPLPVSSERLGAQTLARWSDALICRRVLRLHQHPLLKRHQAAPLSIQTPPGPPFEENKVKLLISVRFIRGTKATGGFGLEQKR